MNVPLVCFAGESGGASAWAVTPVAAHQTVVRISHMAWNPHLPSLMGFVCEDGSLHMADPQLQVSLLHSLCNAPAQHPSSNDLPRPSQVASC